MKPRNEAGPHRPSPLEPIPSGMLWPLEFLHSRCGYSSRARAAAIKAGLPVYRWQKRAWIYTDDLIAFLRREGLKRKKVETAVESEPDSDFSGNGYGKR